MKRILIWSGVGLSLLAAQATAQQLSGGRLAFIRDNELCVADADGRGIRQLTHDGAPKHRPAWSPDGSRLVYERQVERTRALAEIHVIESDGRPVREILFRPPGSELGMRGVEKMWWSDNSRLVLFGSTNPYSCELVVVSVETGKRLSGFLGFCPTFRESPDRSHVAYAWGPTVGAGTEEDWRYGLSIDDRVWYPEPGRSSIRFLSELVWSGDSQSVGLIEEDVNSRELHVTVVTLAGQATRIPLWPSIDRRLALRWLDGRFLLESGENLYELDLAQRLVRPAATEIGQALRHDVEGEQRRQSLRKEAVAVAKALGAKSDSEVDVFLPEGPHRD